MSLPWFIVKLIADLTGESWRSRVCRKLRDMIPFPVVYGNAVKYESNLPFHPDNMITVTSCYTFILNYMVPLINPRFVIVWHYDPSCAYIILKHKDIESVANLPFRQYMVAQCEDFLKKNQINFFEKLIFLLK